MPGETSTHRRLKVLALKWAQEHGLPLAAMEVRVPRSGYRADVAARARGVDGVTALFECKQSRADFLKDAHDLALTRVRLEELSERRLQLESLLAMHRPDLRRGETLFVEYDAWDFSGLEHLPYRRLLAELATLQQRVHRGTKFARLFRYRSADLLYLVVEDDLHAPAESPAGWGLLVRRGDTLELIRPPVNQPVSPSQRHALLEAIALAGTRACNRAAGIEPEEGTGRPVPPVRDQNSSLER
jgi:hypothetical protein